ncbi:hypothetical protein [Ectobacillus ponti]|uniref:Uncharacterized protein n=1 Tax=Ectobacillus ponti TaxID=2961894 RepID=A0AA42BQY0_9BACI|nr:hypothetical protein [Ectobacillus ponti]MCP8970735.1 hypothetical protein [Ectobacillus ponti]
MEQDLFVEWLRGDLQRQGFRGDELEGKVKEQLSFLPKDLKNLAIDAKTRKSSRDALELYIQSLSDDNPQVRAKRALLEGFLGKG